MVPMGTGTSCCLAPRRQGAKVEQRAAPALPLAGFAALREAIGMERDGKYLLPVASTANCAGRIARGTDPGRTARNPARDQSDGASGCRAPPVVGSMRKVGRDLRTRRFRDSAVTV